MGNLKTYETYVINKKLHEIEVSDFENIVINVLSSKQEKMKRDQIVEAVLLEMSRVTGYQFEKDDYIDAGISLALAKLKDKDIIRHVSWGYWQIKE